MGRERTPPLIQRAKAIRALGMARCPFFPLNFVQKGLQALDDLEGRAFASLSGQDVGHRGLGHARTLPHVGLAQAQRDKLFSNNFRIHGPIILQLY